jgi:hypothetical protein
MVPCGVEQFLDTGYLVDKFFRKSRVGQVTRNLQDGGRVKSIQNPPPHSPRTPT